MNLSCFIARCYAVVGSIAQRIARCVVHTARGLWAAVCSTVRAGLGIAQTARRHPVCAAAIVAVTGIAWMFFGWTPLLSAVALVALVLLGVRLSVRLYRWLAVRQAPSVPPSPTQPQRNGGHRLNRSANSVLTPVS
jgi:hypothetical protein